jgi:xanthine dehydrogenase molybdopterin-binding subunit B
MGLLGTILEKLGFGPSAAQAAPQAAPAAPAASKTITAVDVVVQLENLAKKQKEKLNWKVSIVDLLKLLGIESSLAARKELATELGCPTEKMTDSAQMNMWLHKTVLKKLADNGGNIPKELLN